jgi:hypothetical protein
MLALFGVIGPKIIEQIIAAAGSLVLAGNLGWSPDADRSFPFGSRQVLWVC